MRKLVLTLALCTIGCATNKNEEKKDTTPTTPPPTATAPEANNSHEKRCSTDNDCGPKQLCIRAQCVDISADLAECNNVRVHFPLNSSEMDGSEKDGLERAARCLRADTKMHVTVEGNADERGTEEYNLALGDRRATVIAKYLRNLGASPEQMKTVSYGKENPLCSEHDEDCWAKNRRADLKTAEAAGGKKKKR